MFKLLANPGANANNLVRLFKSEDGCTNCPALSQCKYSATIATSNLPITALVIKDKDRTTNKTLTIASGTNPATIKAAIRAALLAEGYDNDGKHGELPDITVTVVSSNTIVTIAGEVIMVSATRTSGSTSFTATCTETRFCTFYAEWAGGASKVFTANGTPATLGDLTFSTASAANVVTAITGAANYPANTTTAVVKNTTSEMFEITLTALNTATFVIDGVTFVRSNCNQDYI